MGQARRRVVKIGLRGVGRCCCGGGGVRVVGGVGVVERVVGGLEDEGDVGGMVDCEGVGGGLEDEEEEEEEEEDIVVCEVLWRRGRLSERSCIERASIVMTWTFSFVSSLIVSSRLVH